MNRVGGFAVQSKEPTLIDHSHRLPERCGLGSKMRRTRVEHILSALPPLATEERTFGIGSSVPVGDIRSAKIRLYSMTSSTCASKIGESDSPSASAVLLLTVT